MAPERLGCGGVRGRALLRLGQAAEARAALDRALAVLPDGEERRDCAAARASLDPAPR